MLQPNFMQYTLGVVAGHGLLTASGDDHKRMKKLLQPAFSAHNVLKCACFICSQSD